MDVRGPRWLAALVIALAAVLVVWLAVGTARAYQAQRTERRGTVTVSRCEFSSFGSHRNSYSCAGAFASGTGDLRVPVVSFYDTEDHRRGARVAATVSGPDDDTATIEPVAGVAWRLVGTVAATAILVSLLVSFRRRRPWRQRRRGRA